MSEQKVIYTTLTFGLVLRKLKMYKILYNVKSLPEPRTTHIKTFHQYKHNLNLQYKLKAFSKDLDNKALHRKGSAKLNSQC